MLAQVTFNKKVLTSEKGEINNLFVRHVEHAFGAYWWCVAPVSIRAKARDTKNSCMQHCNNFNPSNAIIHIGMETFDGPHVERERLQKITDTLDGIEYIDKKLQSIYCHFFQAYSPVEVVWTFDETVNIIHNSLAFEKPPLNSTFLIEK